MSNIPVKQITSHSSVRHVRPRRDFSAMEERRMRAADLFEHGVIPAEIARQVGVSHQISVTGPTRLRDSSALFRQNGRAAMTGRRSVLRH